MMPEYNPQYNSLNEGEKTFQKCLVYIQREFPQEDEIIQIKMAHAVFLIQQVFFNEILPSILVRTLKPSMN